MWKLAAIFLGCTLAGCASGFGSVSSPDGILTLQADSRGLESFGEMLVGVSESRTPQSTEGGFWELRKQAQVKRMGFGKPKGGLSGTK